jgi:pyruvate dehydrogenase E2 component (dihydrolipoamide acetyltransferase)
VPEVMMPRLSDTMTEGVLATWLKHEGDTVQRGDILAEIETDKATMELESFDAGVLTRILVPEGSTVPIGQPIAVIADQGATAEPAQPPAPATVPAAPAPATVPAAPAPVSASAAPAPVRPTPQNLSDVRATPLVRTLAREHDIDLTMLTGTGPNGRIVRADVDAYLRGRSQPGGAPQAAPPLDATARSTGEDVPLTAIRRITAERLTQSAAVPHFHLTAAVDVGPLLELRTELNNQAFAAETRCSVTDLLVRAVALTLAEHREVNASWAGDHVRRHGQINVGIAVALEDGLIVPVVRDADQKSVAEIAAETRALTARARAGRLTPDEFTGGTFTISNLGMFGIDHFTAVINPPEAAILAVGAARDQAVVDGGQVVVRPMMRLTLTSDHRVLDGAVSAAFLRDLGEVLGRPLRLLA